jgi:hypothetical protein
MSAPQSPLSRYRAHRYHGLYELRRVRATVRVGNATPAAAAKERKLIQRELAKLRQSL